MMDSLMQQQESFATLSVSGTYQLEAYTFFLKKRHWFRTVLHDTLNTLLAR